MVRLAIFLVVASVFSGISVAQTTKTPKPQSPAIAPPSDEARNAMQVFQLPEGVSGMVYAAEPDMANPVAIDVDFQNRVFVCESYRQERGIEDNRNHPEWLHEDLAAQTVADRLAYIHKHLGEDAINYTRQDDLIRLLQDTDGDGRADESTIFANRFNAIEEGTGAGVLSWHGDVYYTCIPKLWKLNDADGDGVAESRTALHDGFGVRFAFRGHDLHGLIVGPDGRLYFSIGDRGYHINDQISDPESGAVFRCELDGSNLEVIATGLRNPQELVFDNYGNLFTGDNNSDSGDKARMVYVVQGGDTGWRMAYQYLPDRGPFNREKIWHPYDREVTPAYIVPPIDNFADGPSGFAFYPGSGFSDHMNDRFLLCDFRGQTSGSGIKTFRLKSKGAFWEIADEENTFWNLLATDCCFGPDGRLYVSDWVHGWDGIGKGRIYAFEDENANIELKREVKKLLASEWSKQSSAKLVSILGHSDRRVRLQAQFELVRRNAFVELGVTALSRNSSQLARIHGLWGLDQIDRKPETGSSRIRAHALVFNALLALLRDKDPELQSQAARLMGEFLLRPAKMPFDRVDAVALLSELVRTGNARARHFATISLGKVAASVPSEPLINMLRNNDDVDPVLRHAGIMALVYQTENNNDQWLQLAAKHESVAVRRAAVVALRKLHQRGKGNNVLLGSFLNDSAASMKLEAARAVHDLPVDDLLPQLAELASQENLADPLARRVLNANFRIGDAASIERAKNFALDPSQISERRVDAIRMLTEWNEPPQLDKVLGMWRPIELVGRESGAVAAVEALFERVRDLDEAGRLALMNSVSTLKIHTLAPKLLTAYQYAKSPEQKRTALRALLTLESDFVEKAALTAIEDSDPENRMAALNYLADHDVEELVEYVEKALNSEATPERQNAIAILGRSDEARLRQALARMLSDLPSVSPDSQLDVVLAANTAKDEQLKKLAQQFLAPDDQADPLARYQLTLAGGNAKRGSDIFFNRTDVYCLRCHKINGSGGDVGPDLSDVGTKRDRKYLLESLVEPNKTITENFETVVVLDAEGKIHIGVTKASTEDTLSIMTADAILINIPRDDIDEMRRGESAMPNDVTKHLTLSDLRDLIEYLATRK